MFWETLITALSSDDDGLLVPSKLIKVALCAETDDGKVETIGQSVFCLLG